VGVKRAELMAETRAGHPSTARMARPYKGWCHAFCACSCARGAPCGVFGTGGRRDRRMPVGKPFKVQGEPALLWPAPRLGTAHCLFVCSTRVPSCQQFSDEILAVAGSGPRRSEGHKRGAVAGEVKCGTESIGRRLSRTGERG